MNTRVAFRAEALGKLEEAIDWYESHGKGLGAEVLRAVEAAIAGLERNPQLYPILFGSVRRAPVRRFPYSLIYTANDKDLLIIACFHGRRDPQRWKERLQSG